jgi:hypothetical protein
MPVLPQISLPQNFPLRSQKERKIHIYFLKKFEMKNQILAGRSANLRMKYGYQWVPKGTYTRTG